VKKKLLVLALISTAAYGAWNLRSDHKAPEAASEAGLVLDRIWIDHMPRNDKDMFHAFVAITEQPFGVFQETSQWKGNFELFNYEANGDELRIVYPQNNDRDKVKASATRCTEKGMDFCLELKGNTRGVKRYYSMKGWEIDHAARPEDVRARIESTIHVTP
jgi:hypothetical protein